MALADVYTWKKDGILYIDNTSYDVTGQDLTAYKDNDKKQPAVRKVKAKKASISVPIHVHNIILKKAKKHFSNNYDLQQVYYKQQVKAYLDMQKLEGK